MEGGTGVGGGETGEDTEKMWKYQWTMSPLLRLVSSSFRNSRFHEWPFLWLLAQDLGCQGEKLLSKCYCFFLQKFFLLVQDTCQNNMKIVCVLNIF